MDEFRKEVLISEMRDASEEMAETVITMESAEEERSRPKPAASSAIEALPKYTVTSSDDSKMCSHICPLCRFELSTLEEEGISNIISKSTLEESRKGDLMYELVGALMAVAERVIARESVGEEEISRPKGAASSAIEALPKYTVTNLSNGDSRMCEICMEELRIGSPLTLMPCSHEFHGPCVEQWLKVSYMCPLCRFELPTAEEEVNLRPS
ncbi:hypothetical protein Tsubulata_037058, partial [Turnera subulata]